MSESLSYEVRDTVAVITMDDGKVNALSHAMIEAIQGALDRAEKEAKAVLLVGRAGKFSAGFDLKTMMSGVEGAKGLLAAGSEMYLRIYAYPKPVVAACTGHAMAGGALLLLASDTRIGAAGGFKIGLNEVAISMPLPILGQALARDRLDPRRLTEAAVQARIYDPEGARDVGYLDEVVEPDALLERAHAEAKRLGALPAAAYARTKFALRERTIAYIRETAEADFAAMTPG